MKTKAAGPDMLCFEIIRYYDSFPLLSIRCRIDSPEQEETGKAVTRKLMKKAKAFKRYAEKRLFPLAVTAYQNAVRAGTAPHQFTVSFEGMITTRRDDLIGYNRNQSASRRISLQLGRSLPSVRRRSAHAERHRC